MALVVPLVLDGSRELAWIPVARGMLVTVVMHGGALALRIELTRDGEPATEVAPGVTLEIGPATPLSTSSPSGVRRQADAGWTFFVTRVESPPALVAFYELYDHGVTVVVRANASAAIDTAIETIDAVLRSADIDRTQTEVVALSQLMEMA